MIGSRIEIRFAWWMPSSKVLDLRKLGFEGMANSETRGPAYYPFVYLKLHIYHGTPRGKAVDSANRCAAAGTRLGPKSALTCPSPRHRSPSERRHLLDGLSLLLPPPPLSYP
jgi:hypothetical protein